MTNFGRILLWLSVKNPRWRDLFYVFFWEKLCNYLFCAIQSFSHTARFSVTKCGYRTSERFLSRLFFYKVLQVSVFVIFQRFVQIVLFFCDKVWTSHVGEISFTLAAVPLPQSPQEIFCASYHSFLWPSVTLEVWKGETELFFIKQRGNSPRSSFVPAAIFFID